MSGNLWSETFCDERDAKGKITVRPVTKVLLFILFMTMEYSYAYPIAMAFQKALGKKSSKEAKGLADLKVAGKISSAINAMAKQRLLLPLDEAKKRYPTFRWTTKKEQGAGKKRKYFTINPDVLLAPEKIELSQERREEILHYLNERHGSVMHIDRKPEREPHKPSSKLANKPPEKILWESKSDAELLMAYIGNSHDYSDSSWLNPERGLFLSYSNYLSAIRFMQNYNADPLTIIKYLDGVTTKDYLTVLLTEKTFAGEISQTYRRIQNDPRRPPHLSKDLGDEFTRIVSAEVKKENRVFTNWKHLETARKKTFAEINPSPVRDDDPFLYIVPTDMMGFLMMLDQAITYCIEQERLPHGGTNDDGVPAKRAESPHDSISQGAKKKPAK
jgi:hypothetical protein